MATCVLVDVVCLGLLALWLVGGFSIDGIHYFPYGPDLRLAAAGVLLLGSAWPAFRASSVCLRWVRWAWKGLHLPAVRRWVWLGLIVVGIFMGVWHTLAMTFAIYDVGIFHQILWSLARGDGFTSSMSGAGFFLADHLVLTLPSLLPVFWLTGGAPWTLAVVHPLLLFGGLYSLVFYCERSPATEAQRQSLAAAITVFCMFFGSIWSNLWWGFHANALGFLFLSWGLVLWFLPSLFQGVRWLAFLLLLAAAASKETFLLQVGLGFLLLGVGSLRTSKRQGAGLLLSGVFLLAAFVWFQEQPHPANKNYFIRYYSYLGSGVGEALTTVLQRPWAVFDANSLGTQLAFLFKTLAPWMFLPVAGLWIAVRERRWSDPACLVLMIAPPFLSASLATYEPLRLWRFHYVLELWPVLAFVTVVMLRRYPRLVVIWAVLAVFLLRQDPIYRLHKWRAAVFSMRDLRVALADLPQDGQMQAGGRLGPWVANRHAVTRFPETYGLIDQCPEWVFIPADETARLEQECQGKASYARVTERSQWVLWQRLEGGG